MWLLVPFVFLPLSLSEDFTIVRKPYNPASASKLKPFNLQQHNNGTAIAMFMS